MNSKEPITPEQEIVDEVLRMYLQADYPGQIRESVKKILAKYNLSPVAPAVTDDELERLYPFVKVAELPESEKQWGREHNSHQVEFREAYINGASRKHSAVAPAQIEDKWISVEERLPKDMERIFFAVDGVVWEGLFFEYSARDFFQRTDGVRYGKSQVSHWMAKPKFPSPPVSVQDKNEKQ